MERGNGITWKWNKMEMGEIEMRENGNRESGKWEMGGNRGKWKWGKMVKGENGIRGKFNCKHLIKQAYIIT